MDLDHDLLHRVLAEGPTPLFATVSGAHLYGFPSPDSDVDLRGAFVQPVREALRLRPGPETITVTLQESVEVDWVAHDLRKFALLMTRRNGYVMEQLYSPIVVHGGEWLEELRAIGRGCLTRHLHHHYRGFLRNQRRELAREGATVKALLYAYRVAFTGLHVLRTGEVEANLLQLTSDPGTLDLVARKLEGAEKAVLGPGEAEAHGEALDRLERDLQDAFLASTLPEEPTTLDDLDDFVVRARLALGG